MSPGTSDMIQTCVSISRQDTTGMTHPDITQHTLTRMQRQSDVTSVRLTDGPQIGLKYGLINVTDADQV